jgi:tRNA A37 threonylcarbamoyltransferase TsaD
MELAPLFLIVIFFLSPDLCRLMGGIHPHEAAQHHASVMKDIISSILHEPEKITGIAFSQGPDLDHAGTVAAAARSLALALEVPSLVLTIALLM